MKNLKEFKELIQRYETISFEEIENAFSFNYPEDVKKYLTGFGSSETCILCTKFKFDYAHKFCTNCVYGNILNCLHGIMKESFNLIYNAATPKKLFKAYWIRAKAMREFLKSKGIEI